MAVPRRLSHLLFQDNALARLALLAFLAPCGASLAATGANSADEVYNLYFGAKFTRLFKLETIEGLVFDLAIPQATVFVGHTARPFPVRLGFLEGTREHQRLRTYCEINLGTSGRKSDPMDLLSGSTHLWATEKQIAQLKANGILADSGTVTSNAMTASELRSRTPAFIEQGRYMMNADPGTPVEEKCRALVRPAESRDRKLPAPIPLRRDPIFKFPTQRNDPVIA